MTDRARAVPQDADYEAIATARHSDPFSVLGPHRHSEGWRVAAFLPQAQRVTLVSAQDEALAPMRRVHADGVFEAVLSDLPQGGYRFRLETAGQQTLTDDPYRFGPILGDLEAYLLAEGRLQRSYDVLGAHLTQREGISGASFVVWAPGAARVSVVGTFNDWDGRRHPMRHRAECGAWELFIPGIAAGATYKYEILSADGRLLPLRADPFAFAMEKPPATASVLVDLPPAPHGDQGMHARLARNAPEAPISIYEVHLGSWMRTSGGGYLSYDEIADRLIPYVLELGFTHLELLPVSEHPFDGSWGYQPVGLYAPTSRHGTPAAFARFVARAQQAGLGVIADWVPGHFPSDAHGLGMFDGTHLYEHADPRQGFHQDWNTLIYNYGRNEVRNFLEANALFWLDRYGLDGLRVDAVASMLYLDYSRREGEWVPNRHGGRENLEAIEFLQSTNYLVHVNHAGAAMIAEESTAFPGVSRPTDEGGLGFDYKWNMGWMHDSLSYIMTDPLYRTHHHDKLTFGLVYAFSERLVLPISHDEVVHGKGSLIGKMPGDRWQKFANLRAYLGFMWTHPGKKLLFMGCEFAQEREWNHDVGLDWALVDRPDHAGVQRLVRALNRLYRAEPALHRKDTEPDGFAWIIADDRRNCVFAYLRRGRQEDRPVLVLCNMTPAVLEGYQVGVPLTGRWRCLMSTDASEFGGTGVGGEDAEATPEWWNGQPASLRLTVPPLACIVFGFEG